LATPHLRPRWQVAGDAQRGAPYALHLSRAMVAPHNLRRPNALAKSAP